MIKISKGGDMKKIGLLVIMGLVVLSYTNIAQARVAGVLQDQEFFPNMLQHKTCKQAYNDFLETANPLKACHDLEDTKADLAVQQALINELNSIKGSKACRKKLSQAYEARGACQEKIKIYEAQCPDAKTQHKLIKKIHKQHDEVCKACKNKWPGNVGLYGVKPCSK